MHHVIKTWCIVSMSSRFASKVLRIHQGSKDFFFVLLVFCMVGYFYIWWDLERSIWAADGR